MRSSRIRPISYLKANAAAVLDRLAQVREPMVITQNGEAKAVIQDVASYEETQETLALLKILALGNREVEEGRVRPLAEVVGRLKAKRADALRRPASAGAERDRRKILVYVIADGRRDMQSLLTRRLLSA
jgi:prevent-host-death family protein